MLSGAAIWNSRRFEGETFRDVPGGWERLFDGGDQAFGAAVHVAGGFAPFGERGFAQRAVACHEVERGLAELVAEFFDTVGQLAQARVGNEASDAAQEREAGAFDGGLHPGFDEREGLERVARDEAFVTKLDEPVGDVCGIKPEVLGIEPLATAAVTDGGGDKNSPAAHGVETGLPHFGTIRTCTKRPFNLSGPDGLQEDP